MAGYVSIDARGVELLEEDKQTVPGIYSRVDSAYRTGKMCVVTGITCGGIQISPVPVIVMPCGRVYTCALHPYQLTVDPEDVVTAINIAPAKKGGSK